jgi:CSLREA domain-containing protein
MALRRLASLAAPIALLLVAAAAPAAHAATIHVETTADGLTADSTCTLREAVRSALLNTEQNQGCEVGESGATDTILLPAGAPYQLTRAGAPEDKASTGDLDLDGGPIVIDGDGAAGTIVDGNDLDRVFEVHPGVVATIQDVTVRNGSAPDGAMGLQPGTPTGGAGAGGGGISNDGTLTLQSAVVTDNETGTGGQGAMGDPVGIQSGASGGPGGDGGGIASSGPLTIIDSQIARNAAGAGGAGGNPAPPAGMGVPGNGGPGGSGGAGGGISSSAGAVTIQNSEVSGNDAGAGGNGANGAFSGGSFPPGGSGQGGAGGRGGGVHIAGGAGPLEWRGGKLAGNDAGSGGNGGGNGGSTTPGASGGTGGPGGGLWAAAAATVESLTVDSNTAGDAGAAGPGIGGSAAAGGDGGGLALLGGGTLTGSTVSSNTAGTGGSTLASGGFPAGGGQGGGLLTTGPALTVRNSTFNQNKAGHGGTSFTFGGAGGGGGAIAAGGDLELRQVSVAANSSGDPGTGPGPPAAAGAGGGVRVTGGTTTLANSIVSGNGASNCDGTIGDGGHNLSSGPTCPGANSDPLLGPLADNGGPTQTMAPADGSPAIDSVPTAAGCLATDQRGVARPQRTACDAGAVEREPAPGGTGDDKRPPTVSVKLLKQRLKRALKRGYKLRFTTDEPGSARLDVWLPRGFPKAAKRVLAAASVKVNLKGPGTYTLAAKFTKKAKRKLAHARIAKFSLHLTVKDASNNATGKTKTFKLRR